MDPISRQLELIAGEKIRDLRKMYIEDRQKYSPEVLWTHGISNNGLWFDSTGTRMFVTDVTLDTVTRYQLSTAWNVTTATAIQSISILAAVTNTAGTAPYIAPTSVGAVQGVFLKSDGTQIYFADSTGDAIRQYKLTTAWDLNTIVSEDKFLAINPTDGNAETSPYSPFIDSTGTRLFVMGAGTDTVFRFTLTTAWDVSTAVFHSKRSVATEETGPTGMTWRADGTKFYVFGTTGDDITQYDLSTAWDLSTATPVGTFSVASVDATMYGIFIHPSGTSFYGVGSGYTNATYGRMIHEYSLSTDWSITSASYLRNKLTRSRLKSAANIQFNNTGNRLYLLDVSSQCLNQYQLSTAWDVSTLSPLATDGSKDLRLEAQDTATRGFYIKPDGTALYTVGTTNDRVYQYSLTTAWDISTAVYQNFYNVRKYSTTAVASTTATGASGQAIITVASTTGIEVAQMVTGTGISGNPSNVWVTAINTSTRAVTLSANLTAAASGTYSFWYGLQTPSALTFNPDGTKMYVTCYTDDANHEYNLSTPWDITTATPSYRTNTLSATETTMLGMMFNPDGTRVFVTGTGADAVLQWDLTTPYDIRTIVSSSYRLFRTYGIMQRSGSKWQWYLGGIGSAPSGFTFNNDGTILYVSDDSPDGITSVPLNTAWDVSTAQPDNAIRLSVDQYVSSPQSLFINRDGTKMYITDGTGDKIVEFNITNGNIDTAVYVQQFAVGAQDTSPVSVSFSDDGLTMFLLGQTAIANAGLGIVASEEYIYQYGLTTAWDISTASFSNKFFRVTPQLTSPAGIYFKPDGTKFYVVGTSTDSVFSYEMSTPWDISTSSYTGNTIPIGSVDTAPVAIFFNDKGNRMFVLGQTAVAAPMFIDEINDGYGLYGSEEAIYQFTLSDPWMLPSASYDSVCKSTRRMSSTPVGLRLSADGTKFYFLESTTGSNTVYQFPIHL